MESEVEHQSSVTYWEPNCRTRSKHPENQLMDDKQSQSRMENPPMHIHHTCAAVRSILIPTDQTPTLHSPRRDTDAQGPPLFLYETQRGVHLLK